LPHNAMLAQYMPSLRVCVCVCHSGTVSKWLNVGLHKLCDTIAQGLLVFWCQRARQNSNGITPYEGTKRRWGRL